METLIGEESTPRPPVEMAAIRIEYTVANLKLLIVNVVMAPGKFSITTAPPEATLDLN